MSKKIKIIFTLFLFIFLILFLISFSLKLNNVVSGEMLFLNFNQYISIKKETCIKTIKIGQKICLEYQSKKIKNEIKDISEDNNNFYLSLCNFIYLNTYEKTTPTSIKIILDEKILIFYLFSYII